MGHPTQIEQAAIRQTKSTPESFFLIELFKELEAAKIRYCVLRNYQLLPHTLDGSDLDLLVLPKDFERARKVLRDVASMNGGRCISAFSVEAAIHSFCGYRCQG